jgi:hypothetical protein
MCSAPPVGCSVAVRKIMRDKRDKRDKSVGFGWI